MTEEQAVVIALEDAGFTKETVLWLRTEREDGCFEIEFTDAATGDEYEYEICISTGRIIEAEVEHAHEYGPDYD
jgi:fructoselysine-6-P-deglycase FrlB-like protein